MSDWAPIVHGRTLRVDFRPNLIAAPDDFTPAEMAWAQAHILATTRVFAHSGRPLWSVFTGERRGVVGLTCSASVVSKQMTHDKGGRPLFVFLGYAAPLPVAGVPPMDPDVFAPLYDFVVRRWEEQGYQAHEFEAQRRHLQPYSIKVPLVPAGEAAANFNVDIHRAAVWPIAEGERLWRAAARATKVSLCLGLTRSQEVLSGPFLNATAADASQHRELRRPETSPPPRPLPTEDKIGATPQPREPMNVSGMSWIGLLVLGLTIATVRPLRNAFGLSAWLIALSLKLLLGGARSGPSYPTGEAPRRCRGDRDAPPGFRRPAAAASDERRRKGGPEDDLT